MHLEGPGRPQGQRRRQGARRLDAHIEGLRLPRRQRQGEDEIPVGVVAGGERHQVAAAPASDALAAWNEQGDVIEGGIAHFQQPLAGHAFPGAHRGPQPVGTGGIAEIDVLALARYWAKTPGLGRFLDLGDGQGGGRILKHFEERCQGLPLDIRRQGQHGNRHPDLSGRQHHHGSKQQGNGQQEAAEGRRRRQGKRS